MRRRTLLGAAIALSGVPVSIPSVGADGGSGDTNEPDYGPNAIANTSGGLEVWTATTTSEDHD